MQTAVLALRFDYSDCDMDTRRRTRDDRVLPAFLQAVLPYSNPTISTVTHRALFSVISAVPFCHTGTISCYRHEFLGMHL